MLEIFRERVERVERENAQKFKKMIHKGDLGCEHVKQLEISQGEGLNTPGSCKDQNLEEENENGAKEV